MHLHALMVAVIGKACHAAALAVHLCSCVVVGLDDQAYVPACECHTFSHAGPELSSLSVCMSCIRQVEFCMCCCCATVVLCRAGGRHMRPVC
jgi:hypothetical protein